MPVLQPSEYNASYFDGQFQSLRHNAGYSKYIRHKYNRDGILDWNQWTDFAVNFSAGKSLSSKKVLELGCAKGFIVEDLRALGVDCYGLDVSSYAVGEAMPAVAPYLTVGDARTALASYSNKEFDVLFSRRFIICIPPADMQDLIDEMGRISKQQYHIFDEAPNSTYYEAHPLEWWRDNYNWPAKVTLISYPQGREISA